MAILVLEHNDMNKPFLRVSVKKYGFFGQSNKKVMSIFNGNALLPSVTISKDDALMMAAQLFDAAKNWDNCRVVECHD